MWWCNMCLYACIYHLPDVNVAGDTLCVCMSLLVKITSDRGSRRCEPMLKCVKGKRSNSLLVLRNTRFVP